MKQECKDHALWDKHFSIASWILLLLGTFLGIFTDRIWLGVIFIAVAILIFFIASVATARHMLWHMKNRGDDDENNYFNPRDHS